MNTLFAGWLPRLGILLIIALPGYLTAEEDDAVVVGMVLPSLKLGLVERRVTTMVIILSFVSIHLSWVLGSVSFSFSLQSPRSCLVTLRNRPHERFYDIRRSTPRRSLFASAAFSPPAWNPRAAAGSSLRGPMPCSDASRTRRTRRWWSGSYPISDRSW